MPTVNGAEAAAPRHETYHPKGEKTGHYDTGVRMVRDEGTCYLQTGNSRICQKIPQESAKKAQSFMSPFMRRSFH